jgi:uncharacterized protein (TIGR04255 family)
MSELFANAPLTQAILEARFAGETAIEIARPSIQQAIKAELPNLFVPRAVVAEAPALQPYVFRSADYSESFEIAINRVNYVANAYRGYADFKQRALHFLDIFKRHVPQVTNLNRVGLRYINHIPMLRESPDSPMQLGDYVNIGLTLPLSIPESKLSEMNSVFSVALEGGILKVVLKNELPKTTAEGERLILDFDFVQHENLVIDRLADYVDTAHTHTKRVFMDLVSQKYFPVMRGENA